MRLLMLSWEYPPQVIGGLGRHVHGLSLALAQQGVDVTVLSCPAPGEADRPAEPVRVLRTADALPRARDFLDWVKQFNLELMQLALAQTAAGERYDLIHAHDWLVAPAAKGIKHALRLPLVATIHATEFGRNGGLYTPDQRHIGDIEWQLAYEAWRVICCSEAMREEVMRHYQVPGDKLDVIPNGVWPEAMREQAWTPSDAAAFRQRYAAPDQGLLFFIGRLVHEKGVDTLLQAVRLCQERGLNVKLVVGGRGPAWDALQALAAQLGIAAQVYFTGYLDDATRNRLYAVSDLAVFPSRYEPFGIVALEAMAAGCPVIATRTGGLQEVVVDGRNGLTVVPNDPASLASAIGRLIHDRALADRLRRQAAHDVEQHYHWQAVAKATQSVYGRVLSAWRESAWADAALRA